MAISTVLQWGRTLTEAEKIKRDNQLDILKSSGVTDGSVTWDNDTNILTSRSTRTWTTVEAAQSWVDFVNTFTPAPISAAVVTK